ncbi:hypothetical protein LIER_12954 [Lithospermum erythrorhizon]|uniref:Uncharacterized protein n=1 Tax=Lithospermum erythrorhizon TaxID=34254 RepID=A0AAV3PUF3_LITER
METLKGVRRWLSSWGQCWLIRTKPLGGGGGECSRFREDAFVLHGLNRRTKIAVPKLASKMSAVAWYESMDFNGLLDVIVMCAINPFKCLSGSPFPSNRLNCGSLNPLGNVKLSNRSVKGILVIMVDRAGLAGMTESIIFFKSFNCCCKAATARST